MKVFFRSIVPVPIGAVPKVCEVYEDAGWSYVDALPAGYLAKRSPIINNTKLQSEAVPAFFVMFRAEADFECPIFPQIDLDELMK